MKSDRELECLPSTYYHKNSVNSTFNSDFVHEFRTGGYTLLTILNLISAPLLIFPPFWVKNLKTASRKIVAMIILSDLVTASSTVLGFFIGDNSQKYDFDEADSSNAADVCFLLSFITDVGLSTSLIWQVFMLFR